ncbi:MAG: hypothetical protein ACOCWQ_02960 [Nanoarchaeota archaeon]
MHPQERILFSLMLTILLLFGIVTLDQALTVAGLDEPVLYRSHPEIGYLPVPSQSCDVLGNRISYNEFSQRSPPLLPSTGCRILILGDSQTDGGVRLGDEDIFSSLLRRALKANGYDCEILAAAAKGWSIENRLEYLRAYGDFGADILIVQINQDDLHQERSLQDVGSASFPDTEPSSPLKHIMGLLWEKKMRKPRAVALHDTALLNNVQAIREIFSLTEAEPVLLYIPEKNSSLPTTQLPESLWNLSKDKSVQVVIAHPEDSAYRDRLHLQGKGHAHIAETLLAQIMPLLTNPLHADNRDEESSASPREHGDCHD